MVGNGKSLKFICLFEGGVYIDGVWLIIYQSRGQ